MRLTLKSVTSDGTENATDFVPTSSEKTDDNTWTYTYTNLPAYIDGKVVSYVVYEEALQEYNAPTYDEATHLVITNSLKKTKEVEVTKIWDDEDDKYLNRPEDIELTLLVNGVATDIAQPEFVENEDGSWKYVYTNLPNFYNHEDAIYTVEEKALDEYDTSYDEATHLVITNTLKKTKEVEVTKIWDDEDDKYLNRPEDIELTLLVNGVATDIAQPEYVENEDGNWKYVYTNLPNFYNHEEATYTVEETELPEYDTSYDEKTHLIITNTLKKTKEVEVTKIWDDEDDKYMNRPEDIELTLLVNGEKTDIAQPEFVENEDGSWKYVYTNLPNFYNHEDATYTVEEKELPEYDTTYSKDGLKITNTLKKTKEVEVTKIWDDADDQDGKRPENIELTLLVNGEETDIAQPEYVENEDGTWSFVYTDLPDFYNHEDAIYTIKEETVDGYNEPEYSDDNLTITNTHEVELITITVTKEWAGDEDVLEARPTQVIINLIADDVEIQEAILNDENGWYAEFVDLPVNNDGNPIRYTISEEPVEDYEPEITGSVEDGFVVTNFYSPKGEEEPPHNPQTLDGITYYGLFLILSLIGMGTGLVYRKQEI